MSAHRHGVIHRDIKPGNVLTHDGQPVISDFGIALAVSVMIVSVLFALGLPVVLLSPGSVGVRLT